MSQQLAVVRGGAREESNSWGQLHGLPGHGDAAVLDVDGEVADRLGPARLGPRAPAGSPQPCEQLVHAEGLVT